MTLQSIARQSANHTDSEMPEDWPEGGLERVLVCPLCSGGTRAILHEGLQDHAFNSAPGAWTLKQCGDCGSAYLDPRPNPASIGLAYRQYYTHQDVPADSALGRLRRRVVEAYLNAKYGTSYPNALAGGYFLALLFPLGRDYLDVSYARHLARPAGGNTNLLDVGCGSGEFLGIAELLGWTAEGVDSDAQAVAAARAAGRKVTLGSLDDLRLREEGYQHVTLSHVIEHVHEPLKFLRQCLALLAPGGRLWIETPNVQSVGHDVFGASWRGLEPPRHLALFDRRSLTSLLASAGYSSIEFRRHPGVTIFMWQQSRMIAGASGRNFPAGFRRLMASYAGMIAAEAYGALRPDKAEFLTCTAFRPDDAVKTGA